MKKANLIVSAVIALLGIVIIIVSAGYPTAEAYGTGAPGPGLWPICISVILLLMSALLAAKTLGKGFKDTPLDLKTANHLRVYLAMIILIIYLVILKLVGFLIPSFLMLTGVE